MEEQIRALSLDLFTLYKEMFNVKTQFEELRTSHKAAIDQVNSNFKAHDDCFTKANENFKILFEKAGIGVENGLTAESDAIGGSASESTQIAAGSEDIGTSGASEQA